MPASSAARGQESDQIRHRIPLHRVVDVPLFLAALDEPGPSKSGEVMRQRGPRNLQRLLKLSRRDLLVPPDQQEEELEPRLVGEGGEGLHVLRARVEGGPWTAGRRFHISIDIKISRGVKGELGRQRPESRGSLQAHHVAPAPPRPRLTNAQPHVVSVPPAGLVASSTAPKTSGAIAPAPKPRSERRARPDPR